MGFDDDVISEEPNKTKVVELDDDFLELAASNSRYSTELNKQRTEKTQSTIITTGSENKMSQVEIGDNFIVINGRKIQTKTMQVDADQTVVWAGNPRNFELDDVEVDDLFPSIESSEGNTIPVFGRYKKNSQNDTIEILAGSRRRICCIKGRFKLLVLLIDCNDKEAYTLTKQENDGRKDTSFIANCRWHLAQFDSLKTKADDKNHSYTQQMYALSQNVTLTTMQDYLSFAKFPNWVFTSVETASSWSYRACNDLRKLITANKSIVESVCTSKKFSKATELIRAIKDKGNISKSNQLAQQKNNKLRRTFNIKNTPNAVQIMDGKEGVEIKIAKNMSTELLYQIEKLIEQHSATQV